jgi:hypothetical protein
VSQYTLRVAAAVLVVVLAIAGTAAAQGRGRGRVSRGTTPTTSTRSQTSPSPVTLQPSPSFPQFGTWLDDATTAISGAGYGSIGISYWRGSDASQVDAPILGATYGISNRAQVSATVPFYRFSYQGFSQNGLDNVYVSTKIAVVDPRDGRFGLAVGAVAEILGAGFVDASRVPLSLELRGETVRVYGSTGYFSRGAYFAAGAFEWTAPAGTSVTASLAHSASVSGVTIATTGSVPRAGLREVGVFVSHPVSNVASVYVGGSRTFSDTWIDGASSVSGGVSFQFAGPRAGATPN